MAGVREWLPDGEGLLEAGGERILARDGLVVLRQARLEGTSKAALIRRFVRLHLAALPPLEDDPLGQMIGQDSFEPESVDDVVYP